MNNCLVAYIKRDVACRIDNETIMHRFQNIKTCKKQLYNLYFLSNNLRKILGAAIAYHSNSFGTQMKRRETT